MSTNFPYESIFEMKPWDFWSHPLALELSDEDAVIAQCAPDVIVPREAADRILSAAKRAACELRDANVNEPFRNPS